MHRSYYSASVTDFLVENPHSILGRLSAAHSFSLNDLQKNAWVYQIDFLQREISSFHAGHIVFEFSIPRMGKRVDNVLILGSMAFVIEFKVGQEDYSQHSLDQVLDYSLDLKNFHEGSRDIELVPILLATSGPSIHNDPTIFTDGVWTPLKLNAKTFTSSLKEIERVAQGFAIDPKEWEFSEYRPTPTIVEAAQVLYEGHDVASISRSDAANLSSATDAVFSVIDKAKSTSTKAICFLTGVPGSGKTLAGLNLATQRQLTNENEHAVFLSGNGPLVKVLQEALARSNVKSNSSRISKEAAKSKTKAFIQIIHHFRDEALINSGPPLEKVVIFDEAQRAWTMEHTRKFMAQKKGVSDFKMSEPEFLISVMDRHLDWAVLVCLIGGGQEINTGEAGLPEWFSALSSRFPDWKVYVSDQLAEYEHDDGVSLYDSLDSNRLIIDRKLHLAASIRSFRSEKVSQFVKALLDIQIEEAQVLCDGFRANYPVVVTRDLEKAKRWIKSVARGSERFGLVASSGAQRLRPLGISVKAKIDPPNWFLNEATDVRSSYYLEEAATEFDIQGLELDWVLVAWDADLRFDGFGWKHMDFRGTAWNTIGNETRKMYLKNAYRVLLTRARQGMVIFVPYGDQKDSTRIPEYYDGTYEYLRKIGINEIDESTATFGNHPVPLP